MKHNAYDKRLYSIRGRVVMPSRVHNFSWWSLHVRKQAVIWVHLNEGQREMLNSILCKSVKGFAELKPVMGVLVDRLELDKYKEGTSVGITLNHVSCHRHLFQRSRPLEVEEFKVVTDNVPLVAELLTE